MGIADTSLPTKAAPRRAIPALEREVPRAVRPIVNFTQVLARDAVYRRFLVVSDAAASALALVIGGALVAGGGLQPAAIAVIPVVIGLAKVFELYDRDVTRVHKTTLEELPHLLQLASIVTILCVIAQGVVFTAPLGAAGVASLWLTMLTLLCIGRGAARAVANEITPPERCLFIGDQNAADDFDRKLGAQRANAKIVSVLEPPPTGRRRDDVATEREELVARILPIIGREQIHRVILASGPWHSEDFVHSISGLRSSGVRVSVLPEIARLATLSFDVDHLPGIALLGMRGFEMGRSSQRVKRAFDAVFAALALLFLAPLLAAVAIAIKLESPGPVLFRQKRVGREGDEFEMLKFRSMFDGADDRKHELHDRVNGNGLFKLEEDPRVTRVGRFIRRFSVDELPQLINVLRGDMSLVGPRPLVPIEDAMIHGHNRRRLEMRPGLTGHWQILGSLRVPLEEMVTLDYVYVANWSLWTDFKIIARTIPYLAFRGNV